MKQMETSSPRPSPPQVCGGEGEEARGGGVKMRPFFIARKDFSVVVRAKVEGSVRAKVE
jgi:hypothetical protein